jgi:eukaryotic-like serine/threonine-protein kinase
MRFTYSSGQRPLDGYTLKRGIGKGGFGEVYFAVSDGGKEVALKLVRGGEPVELRGVAQCLNLKHPNLVALFDLRTDARGDHWVVMEHVSGEGLHSVLTRHPNGLPMELARDYFLGLAKAVGYLHDHGIVHRDLKPANIFIENGTVKVGDYGLSKSISDGSARTQTQSVGTVHYMAPEIGTGNYNKQVDTYAAGVILYEMVTGKVPFDGDSVGEVLMKHLTSAPDLSRAPAEWRGILGKALSKNPTHRYASMAEMAAEVEKLGQEPVVALTPVPARPTKSGANASKALADALPAVTVRDQLAELTASMVMAVVWAVVPALVWYLVGQLQASESLTLFYLTVAATWLVLVPAKFWTERRGDSWLRRGIMLGLGTLLGLFALWMQGWTPVRGELFVQNGGLVPLFPTSAVNVLSYCVYYGLAFFALRWWKMTARQRRSRFSVLPVIAAAFWSLALLLIITPQTWTTATVLVFASAIVQIVSPWEAPPPPAVVRRVRRAYA